MTGGLLQIASFGKQDIFLTGSPEITFFKYVYRRYTNFSIETIEEYPDGIPNFDEKITFTLSKNADIVHKIYLKITLPKVDIVRNINISDENLAKNKYQLAKKNWEDLNKYSNYIVQAYNLINRELEPINANPLLIYNQLQSFFENDIDTKDYNEIQKDIKANIKNNTDILAEVESIINSVITQKEKLDKISQISNSIKRYLENKNYIYYQGGNFPNKDESEDLINVLDSKKNFAYDSSPRYNFAWINRIGHYIVDMIEIDIGGTIIDRHYNDWINIWYELTKSYFKEDIYNKMIGSVPELTTYNRNIKSEYTLYLPLYFWFNSYNGISIPLICLAYQDIKINIKFNSLINCIISDYKNLNIDNIIKLENVSIYCDYIYLDNIERKKFVNGNHEYIIPQIQTEIFRNISSQQYTCSFNTMYPTKEMIWIIQKEIKRTYNDLDRYIDWSNYSFIFNNISNSPLLTGHISISGHERFKNIDYNFFNYVQPYIYHNSCPSDGIYTYSFSLNPEDNQPSGSCNMTKHEAKHLVLEMKNEFINYLDGETYMVKLFSINYNILRFMGGLSGLAFLY
jgi:hypothetical protein